MVILIGGNSHTGKTLMSHKLLEKYKISYFSIDHLKMGLYRSNKKCGFTPLDSDELIGNELWPIIKEMIMTVIENNQNIIIEGCYLLPDLVSDFEKEYLEQIVSVFLGFSTEYIKENFNSDIMKYRNIIESRGQEERTVADFIYEHNDFRKRCIENNVNYFEINKNYEREILRVYDYIDEEINKNKKSIF